MMDNDQDNRAAKPASKLGELFSTLLSIVTNRFRLASLECQEYASGILFGVIWLIAGLLALQIAIVSLLILAALITPVDWRVTVFLILALIFFGIFLGTILMFRRHLTHLTAPLATTLTEVRKDLETLVRER